VKRRKLRVLDFDIECRPIAWYGGDFVTKQPTTIAWKYAGEGRRPTVTAIGESDRMSLVLEEEAEMLEAFRVAFDDADMVTGHYIRGFDLPVLQGAYIRLGLKPLGAKLAEDTKQDLLKAQGMSKSMENLSAMFKAKCQKYGMDTAKWADANMLLPEGIKKAKARVTTDVREHLELRAIMAERGLLSPAKLWLPGGASDGSYSP
jgi:DNA polymerase elongation subunit (family B)